MKKPKVRLHRSKHFAWKRRFRRENADLIRWFVKKLSKRTRMEILSSDNGSLVRIFGVSLHDF